MPSNAPLHVCVAVAVAAAVALPAPALGHETDQFTVPVGEEFADLGPYFNGYVRDTIAEAVDDVNAKIKDAVEDHGEDSEQVRKLQAQAVIAQRVRQTFPNAVDLIESLERDLHTEEWQQAYPGKIVAYKDHGEIDFHTGLHPFGDLRVVSRLFRASTVMLYDTYLGTDKLGHWLDMGYHYYKRYRKGIDKGLPEHEAMQAAVRVGTDDPIMSEKSVLGFVTAGAYSNADLASNYMGLLFYRNLTEPMLLEGRWRPPLLERDGPYWKLAGHTADGEFYRWYISDHWNEALNPSLFDAALRPRLKKNLENHRDALYTWYSQPDGSPRDPTWFTAKVHELATYWGQSYGHSGQFDKLVHIGTLDPPTPEAEGPAKAAR